MFNLFKSKTEQLKVETIVSEKKSKYPKIVDEIHNEFFTAGDKILEEANAILAECKLKDINKGKRLASLGFVKTPQSVQALETERLLISTKEVAELVSYYSIHYPNNKFITEEQVKQICEKYNLVCGGVSMYKGFVPEKNINHIEKFKLKHKDVPFAAILDNEGIIRGTLNKSDFHETDSRFFIDRMRNGGEGFFTCNDNGVSHLGYDTTEKYGTYSRVVPFDSTYKICAPLKDMEIPENKRLIGHKILHVPDPVVLQPVKGGYLIITAWGDEASDEIIVNQTLN